MARRIARAQLQKAIQQRHRLHITRLIVNLGGAGQRGYVVGRNLQCLLKCFEGAFVFGLAGECDPLQRPQLCIIGSPFQSRARQCDGVIEIVDSKRGGDLLHWRVLVLWQGRGQTDETEGKEFRVPHYSHGKQVNRTRKICMTP